MSNETKTAAVQPAAPAKEKKPSVVDTCILMGTLIGHYARIVLVTGSNKKWHPLLIVICLLDAAISLVIMRVILAIMGIQ